MDVNVCGKGEDAGVWCDKEDIGHGEMDDLPWKSLQEAGERSVNEVLINLSKQLISSVVPAFTITDVSLIYTSDN